MISKNAMRDDNLTHAYVGYRPCGHAGFLYVDDASKTLSNEVAKLIRRQWTIVRKTLDDARATPLVYCDCAGQPLHPFPRCGIEGCQLEVDHEGLHKFGGPIRGRKTKKPDRREVERRADKRRQDDKTKARLKR